MERSYLIQRLNKPRGGKGVLGLDNPFSFGGGLKNGGLSDGAMDLLRAVFSFDYMGAAEFEFGAVPKALQTLAQSADKLTAFSFDISLSDVAADWRDKSPAPDGEGTIYVLCPADWATEIEQRIREWAGGDYNGKLKEATRLSSSLRPYHEWDGEIAGWLELDNGFMFFTDEDMWRKTSELFGVETGKVEK